MSFSMLFCIVFTMGAVFFDCEWEKVPNLWIIAGLQISMAEHLSGEVIQGLGSAVIRFWGGIFLVLFLFFPLFLGKMIGTGDIKVLAVLGSVLGPRKILFCIVTAFLLGAVESLFLLFFRCDWRQRFLYFFQYLQRAYVERSLPPYLVPGKRPENRQRAAVVSRRIRMSERNIFAVCDLDVDYAYHFMEYLSKKKNIPFEVRVFTSAAGFREYVKEHPVELLLISEKAMNSEIREAKIGQILILSDGVVSKGYEEYPSIYKYQSSNQVIREALEHYGEGVGTTAQTLKLEKKKMEVIGVYSPVGRTMKTTFALTLGQILAKKRACLYLNLEACSGFEYLLERSFDQTLGDLLYYQRLGSEQLITKMGSIVQSVNNLDYLPPVLSMEDIQSTTAQEWISLLQQIIDYSNYDVVILDLSDSVSQLYKVLEQCTRIYMPIRADPVSQAKIHQFEHTLQVWEKQMVLDRIRKIKLPYHRSSKTGIGYMDDLVWSELGDYVREMLRTEREDG